MNAAIEARLAAVGASAADVEEKFVRGSGPGGQKINKTSSTVWLRHGPTGIEVRRQTERSQSQNREEAWIELCTRLENRRRSEAARQQDERERARRRTRQKSHGQKVNMIRSKKHRSKTKSGRGRVESD